MSENTHSTDKQELPQFLTDYFSQKLEGELVGIAELQKAVRKIYDDLFEFETRHGLEILKRPSAAAIGLGMQNEFGIWFVGVDACHYDLSSDGQFSVYKKMEGQQLQEVEKENEKRRNAGAKLASELVSPWGETSISSAQFIGAYLEAALQQLEQSAQQEKKLNAVSAITDSLSKIDSV